MSRRRSTSSNTDTKSNSDELSEESAKLLKGVHKDVSFWYSHSDPKNDEVVDKLFNLNGPKCHLPGVRHSKACENNPNCVHGIVQSNSSFEVNPKSKGNDDDGDDGDNKKSASRKRSNEVKSKRGRPSKRGRAHEADDGSDSFHLDNEKVEKDDDSEASVSELDAKTKADNDKQAIDKKPPVGLKNFGATCYVNSLIQMLFFIDEFRRAVYEWHGKEGVSSDEYVVGVLLIMFRRLQDEDELIVNMQRVFAFLQCNEGKSYAPDALVDCLALERHVQQDVQEFLQLLLNNIDESFQCNSDETKRVRSIADATFGGTLKYTTKCSRCKTSSYRQEAFVQLHINILKQLENSVEDFLKPEKLEGDNQYFCSECGEKQDAERSLSLGRTPEYCCFLLKRFKFDPQTTTKRKVHSTISYPSKFDLAPYRSKRVEPEERQQSTNYRLVAVIEHKGPSAYGGHYVMRARDPYTRLWWRFDDDDVTPDTKFARALQHKSKEAYLLLYQRVPRNGRRPAPSLPSLPPSLQSEVDAANAQLVCERADKARADTAAAELHDARQAAFAAVAPLLPVRSSTAVEAVDTWSFVERAYLRAWAHDPLLRRCLAQTRVLCEHDAVDPRAAAADLVRVERDGWLALLEQHRRAVRAEPLPTLPEARHLSAVDICELCLRQCCDELHKRACTTVEHLRLVKLLPARSSSNKDDAPEPSDDDLWVNAVMLNRWRADKRTVAKRPLPLQRSVEQEREADTRAQNVVKAARANDPSPHDTADAAASDADAMQLDASTSVVATTSTPHNDVNNTNEIQATPSSSMATTTNTTNTTNTNTTITTTDAAADTTTTDDDVVVLNQIPPNPIVPSDASSQLDRDAALAYALAQEQSNEAAAAAAVQQDDQQLSQVERAVRSGETFTSELQCTHKAPDSQAPRRRIPRRVWDALIDDVGLAALGTAVSVLDPDCTVCGAAAETQDDVSRERRKQLHKFKRGQREGPGQRLTDLDVLRKSHTTGEAVDFYFVPEKWLERWREFVHDYDSEESPGPLDATSLLCCHGESLYTALDSLAPIHTREQRFLLMPTSVYKHLAQWYGAPGIEPTYRLDPPLNLPPRDRKHAPFTALDNETKSDVAATITATATGDSAAVVVEADDKVAEPQKKSFLRRVSDTVSDMVWSAANSTTTATTPAAAASTPVVDEPPLAQIVVNPSLDMRMRPKICLECGRKRQQREKHDAATFKAGYVLVHRLPASMRLVTADDVVTGATDRHGNEVALSSLIGKGASLSARQSSRSGRNARSTRARGGSADSAAARIDGVSADTTGEMLKMLVCATIDIDPSQQQLYIVANDPSRTDWSLLLDTETLAEAGVTRGQSLLLHVDKSASVSANERLQDQMARIAREPEDGFANTRLFGGRRARAATSSTTDKIAANKHDNDNNNNSTNDDSNDSEAVVVNAEQSNASHSAAAATTTQFDLTHEPEEMSAKPNATQAPPTIGKPTNDGNSNSTFAATSTTTATTTTTTTTATATTTDAAATAATTTASVSSKPTDIDNAAVLTGKRKASPSRNNDDNEVEVAIQHAAKRTSRRGTRKRRVRRSSKSSKVAKDVACPSCTFINPPGITDICTICGSSLEQQPNDEEFARTLQAKEISSGKANGVHDDAADGNSDADDGIISVRVTEPDSDTDQDDTSSFDGPSKRKRASSAKQRTRNTKRKAASSSQQPTHARSTRSQRAFP